MNQQIRKFFEHEFDNHVINTKNAKSSFESLYNLSTIKLTILRKYLNDLLNKNWIRLSINFAEISMLFIFKKNDTLRLCVDYQKLNRIIKKNRHSLSFIFQILNVMIENKYFTKINLRNVYHRIKINKKNEWKTTFRTRYEHFEYLMMFFELINVSTTFQIHVNKTLKNLIDIVCVIYLKNILIFSKNRKSHFKNVTIVLRKLKKFRLYVKLKKCFFFVNVVKYLKFIVTRNDVTMNFRRIIIIRNWFISRFFKNIQIFFEFTNFYWRFIYEYFWITLFLTNMLKKMKKKTWKKNRFIKTKTRRKRLIVFAKFSKKFLYWCILIFNCEFE